MPKHRAEDPLPEATATGTKSRTLPERETSAIDPTAKPGQKRREDRERSGDSDGDDDRGAGGDSHEHPLAGQQQPGHRDDHGQPRNEYSPARGTGGDRQRMPGGQSAGALLSLAPDVEERVVDADGKSDEQHDRARRVVDWEYTAGETDEPAGRDQRGQGEPDRNESCDQRAEHKEEDHERDRDRELLGALEVLSDRVVQLVCRARLSELCDVEAWMRSLLGGDCLENRLDVLMSLVRFSAHVELDQCRVAVLRDQVPAAAIQW